MGWISRTHGRALQGAAVGLLLAGMSAGCGPGELPPNASGQSEASSADAGGAENRPPRIDRVELRPDRPTRADLIQLAIVAVDPDRDSLQFDVEWLRNGAPHRRGSELQLATDDLRQGDRIQARVTASDGHASVTGETTVAIVGNSPPRISKLELLPAEPSGADNLMAVAEGIDPDEDDVAFRYEWWKNDAILEGATGPTLDASTIARGDEIQVRVTPTDSNAEGETLRSVTRMIRNAPPRITSQPTYAVAGPNLYEYSVTADDPDGDRPLRFDLVDGPKGMEIDLVSGHLSWVVPPSFSGTFEVEVGVRDPLGGESRQRYAIDLNWQAPDSAPAAPATPERY